MGACRLVISPAARNDLKDICQFSARTWGAKQSVRYLDKIKECFWALTEQPLIGIDRFDLLPGMRSFAVESHIVFYLVRFEQIEIVRVLHGRQDPNRHIES